MNGGFEMSEIKSTKKQRMQGIHAAIGLIFITVMLAVLILPSSGAHGETIAFAGNDITVYMNEEFSFLPALGSKIHRIRCLGVVARP